MAKICNYKSLIMKKLLNILIAFVISLAFVWVT